MVIFTKGSEGFKTAQVSYFLRVILNFILKYKKHTSYNSVLTELNEDMLRK